MHITNVDREIKFIFIAQVLEAARYGESAFSDYY